MLTRLFRPCAHLGRSLARTFRQRLITATQPAAGPRCTPTDRALALPRMLARMYQPAKIAPRH